MELFMKHVNMECFCPHESWMLEPDIISVGGTYSSGDVTSATRCDSAVHRWNHAAFISGPNRLQKRNHAPPLPELIWIIKNTTSDKDKQ